MTGAPVAAAVHGVVDVVPLGVAGPGALAFGLVFLIAGRPSAVRTLALRSVGAVAIALAALVVVAASGPATVRVTPAGRALSLTVRPDVASTVVGGIVAMAAVLAVCWALAAAWHRRDLRPAAAVAACGGAVVALLGVAAAAALAAARPGVAAVALLAGPNIANGPSIAAGPASGAGPRFPGTALNVPAGLSGPWTTSLRVAAILALALVCTIVVTLVERRLPATGSRWRRAGLRAATGGVALALALVAIAVAARVSVQMRVSVLFFEVPALALELKPSLLGALAAGLVGGAFAGLVGSLIADVVRRPTGAAARSPVPVTQGGR
jgi:hypothetical protein